MGRAGKVAGRRRWRTSSISGDLPAGLDLGPVVAIDTETMGLLPARDRLCLVQLSAGDGDAHLVQVARRAGARRRTSCALLGDPAC